MFSSQGIFFAALLSRCVHAQDLLRSQNNTWNSSVTLPVDLAKAADLSELLNNNFEVAWNFERTNWAGQSAASDSFYKPPPVNASTPPGTLLRVDQYTNTSRYTIASSLALSRILFTSSTFNGTTVPTSAYILWPWKAKTFKSSSYTQVSGIPVIGFAHGTSGVYGECAPSNFRNLWYHYSAPYSMAMQGYAVVAPDYAGLGVSQTHDGKPIVHQCYANQAHADDLFYAIEAAQTAFPELSKQFVTVGHSQGGGAAWAGAQRQVSKPVEGYLGTVAAAPVSSMVEIIRAYPDSLFKIAGRMAPGIRSIFPDFDPSQLLLKDGLKRLDLLGKVQGCNSLESTLWSNSDRSILSKPNWQENWYVKAFDKLTSNGEKKISGPMLVLQGAGDLAVNANVTSTAVKKTCSKFPDSQITEVTFEGVKHVPVMNSGMQILLDWVEDRFLGVEVPQKCQWEHQTPLRKSEAYQQDPNFFLQWMVYQYAVP